jgi:hypothetical protein
MEAAPARTHVIVVSDLHLSEPEPGDSAWLRHRQARFFPDDDLAKLVSAVRARLAPGDRLSWVFGGDVLELDGPEVDAGVTRFPTEARGAAEASVTVRRVLAAHPGFVRAVASLLDDGHDVTFVAGNHDVQLTFPEVAEALMQVLAAACGDPIGGRARLAVRPWFFRAPLGVHVEHGHQYDPYCAYRNPVAPLAPLSPLSPEGGRRAETMGSLSFRHLVQRMGYFNAHDERSFMLSVPAYLAHWARNYAFGPRSLALTWFVGALRTVNALLRGRPRAAERRAIEARARDDARAYVAATLGAGHGPDAGRTADEHAKLFAAPADAALGRVLRELHLDQVACLLVAALGASLALASPGPVARALGAVLIALSIVFPLLQGWLSPKRALAEDHRRVDGVARALADVYAGDEPTRAVIFGHTHAPHARRERGVLVLNAGAWTPSLEQTDACDRGEAPPLAARPFVWLNGVEGIDAPLAGGLFRLRAEAIERAAVEQVGAPEGRTRSDDDRATPRPRLAPTPAE